MKNKTIINSEQSLNAHIANLKIQFEKFKYLNISIERGAQRTNTQNRSLHMFCDHLAQALNDGGYDFRTFVKEGYEIPFDEYLVKKYIWKPVQKAMTGNDSTTKPKTHEYAMIYDVINRKMAEYGVSVSWPSVDSRGDK